MELFILIIQIILAILMGYYAVPKLIFSKETLKAKGGEKMDYVDNLSSFSLVVIGLIELFTALGLILSGFMAGFMWLCILSCLIIIVTMIGALFLHIVRKDGGKAILVNFLYIFISSVVLFGNLYFNYL